MKSTMTALGVALAVAAAGSASPAAAQQQGQAQAEAQKIAPSPGAAEAIIELQRAVVANDVANIPARVAAAQAVAQTPEDRYLIAALRYRAAVAANDDAAKTSALEAMIASGKMDPARVASAYRNLAVSAYNANQFEKARANIERALATNPNDAEALVLLAESQNGLGRPAEAVATFERAIEQARASGQQPKEDWYKRAVSLAYDAKLPKAVDLSRRLAVAYPTPGNWRNSIRIYRNLQRPPESILIDLLRLGRTVNALEGTIDYHPYGYTAIQELAPAEAKAVVEEGIAAGSINADDQVFRDILAEANTKSQGQRDRLPALTSDALASPTAKMAMTAGNIHFGYGNYAEAAELYRAALGKSGADKDLANLRLGMALARAGDKAGATAALNAVGGPRAEIAKYWLAYLQTRA